MRNSPSKQDFKSKWELLINTCISNRFTAGVQSTQRVEGINGIIKSNLTNRTSLSKLTSVLDSQLARESIVEIAEALWYSAILVSKEDVNINMLQEKNKIGFYENLDDFPATKLDKETTRYRASYKNYVIILKNGDHVCTCMRLVNRGLICRHFAKVMTISQIATFYILMIPRCWYLDEHYSKSDEILESQPSITYKNGSAILTSNFMSNSTLIYSSSSISFNASRTLNTRRAYGITNGLCKKAITHLVTKTALNEVQDNESSDSDDKQENSIPFDVSKVQDPVVKRKKGAPKVKRIKCSHETTNIRKKKAARLCSRYKQPNHYAKTCTANL
ncbi:17341_t:CDS:2 [Gigaspora rosea]|nr:17341_t:CDS:2 [Gigaspora rosea]